MLNFIFIFLFSFTGLSYAGSIVDETGKTITADAPKRIVTLSGNVTETVFALGLSGNVVGVDASSLYPEGVKEKTNVGYYRNVSAEGILSLSPDLVIATDAAGPPPVIEQIRASGIPIAILSSAHSLESAQTRIKKISKLLDKEKEGHALVWNMEDQMKGVVKPETPPKVLFIYARGAGTQNVAGKETAADSMITLSGGVNCTDGYTGYKPMNAEAIIAAAPDYILLTDGGLKSLGGVDAVSQIPGISETPAGQNKRIISIDDLLLLGFGPRMAEAALELSKAITP